MTRSLIMSLVALLAVASLTSGSTKAEAEGDPALARRLTDLGIAAQSRDDHVAALAYFERARRDVDHPKIRYFEAKSLDALGRFDEALTAFRGLTGDEQLTKYAGEVSAYSRAIVAEREQARLKATLAQLVVECPAAGPVPVK